MGKIIQHLSEEQPVSWPIRYIVPCVFLLCMAQVAYSQTAELHGQASGWFAAKATDSPSSRIGLRYIPDLLARTKLADELEGDLELSLNTSAIAQYRKAEAASYNAQAKLYRAWFRISSERFEARAGLQKISFGPALLFRPLMWFDRIDPRDPLQLTDGVYGLLGRYYFPNNANVWLWGLLGNTGTKGWELEPTQRKSVEFGGRAQLPLWTGEVGITYHHRRADLSSLFSPPSDTLLTHVPEDRIALDGKWDITIGVWFEAVLIRQETDIPLRKYQREWTVGADYTFAIGSGLYAATEYFRTENPEKPLTTAGGRGFSGLSLSYPLGILDHLSAMLFHDWTSGEWYRILTWQRKYDDWSFYVLGFWNPETIRLYRAQSGASAFAGTGFQIMVVFNH